MGKIKNRVFFGYSNDKDEEEDKEKATKMTVSEYDEEGNRKGEAYFRLDKPLSEEEAEKYWDEQLRDLNIPENLEKKENSFDELYYELCGEPKKKK